VSMLDHDINTALSLLRAAGCPAGDTAHHPNPRTWL